MPSALHKKPENGQKLPNLKIIYTIKLAELLNLTKMHAGGVRLQKILTIP